MSQLQNLNQFNQLPIKGQLDLAIMSSGVITGVVSSSQATALVPGQKVTIDTAVDVFTPSFVAAAYNASAFGIVIYKTSKSPSAYSATSGEALEVALLLGHCNVMWMETAAAVTAGGRAESTSGNLVSNYGTSNKAVGYFIDGASAAGKLVRVLMTQQALS